MVIYLGGAYFTLHNHDTYTITYNIGTYFIGVEKATMELHAFCIYANVIIIL